MAFPEALHTFFWLQVWEATVHRQFLGKLKTTENPKMKQKYCSADLKREQQQSSTLLNPKFMYSTIEMPKCLLQLEKVDDCYQN